MRKILVSLTLILLSTFMMATAQKAYKVVYKLAGQQSGWGNLLVSNQQTYYYTTSQLEVPQEAPKSEKIMGYSPPTPTIERDESKAKNSRVLYYRANNKPLLYVERVTDNLFSVSDDLVINWTIVAQENKKIGGYACQKATAQVRGRDFEVWFTTEIQASGGPWKLYNLSGLILEAVSTDKNYQFLFEKIETIDEPTANLKYSFKNPILTYQQYVGEVDKYQQLQTDELQKKSEGGWKSIFSDAKTTGMTMKTMNIEKTLEKVYTANVKK